MNHLYCPIDPIKKAASRMKLLIRRISIKVITGFGSRLAQIRSRDEHSPDSNISQVQALGNTRHQRAEPNLLGIAGFSDEVLQLYLL